MRKFLNGTVYSTTSADQVVEWFERVTGREPTSDDVRYVMGVFVAEVTYRPDAETDDDAKGDARAPGPGEERLGRRVKRPPKI